MAWPMAMDIHIPMYVYRHMYMDVGIAIGQAHGPYQSPNLWFYTSMTLARGPRGMMGPVGRV